MRKLDYFWKSNKDWYYRKENGACVLKDTAPEEAKRSYEHFLEQSREAERKGFMD